MAMAKLKKIVVEIVIVYLIDDPIHFKRSHQSKLHIYFVIKTEYQDEYTFRVICVKAINKNSNIIGCSYGMRKQSRILTHTDNHVVIMRCHRPRLF